MQLQDVGEVIATRTLFLVGDPNREIVVKMGKPQLFPEGRDYFTRFKSPESETEGDLCGGVDAFQAIELASKLIAIELRTIRDRFDVRFARWDGDETGTGGFGFLSAEEMVRDDRNR